MLNAIKSIPWFEIVLILGLAVALIVKPQTKVFSASPEAADAAARAQPFLPAVTASTSQPDVGS